MATPPALWSDVAARSIATWPGAGAGVLRFSLAAHDGRRPRGVGAGRPFDVARLETPDVAAANAGAHSSVFGCQIEIRKLPSGSVGPALARRSRPSERSLRASAMTDADIRTSPGRELGSMAAALVTPSPLILSPSTRISPTLTPTQNAMRLSVGTVWLRLAISAGTCVAQRTARAASGNSAIHVCPTVPTRRPPLPTMSGSINTRR